VFPQVALEGQMLNFFEEDLERLLNIPMIPRLFEGDIS